MIDRLSAAAGRAVPRETVEQLETYAALLARENARQNLVSRSTIGQLWERHIIDSAQLVRLAPSAASWVDVGSGAGLPGLVVAMLTGAEVLLVEPRRLRAEFLAWIVDRLGLGERVRVARAKVERVSGRFDAITARAVAPLPHFLALSHHLSTENTRWVLPRGRSWQSELDDARRTWQGVFHVEPSFTDQEARILVLTAVGAK